jgi:hypothetical protein
MGSFESWKNNLKFPSFMDLPIKSETPILFYFLVGTTTLALTYITLLDSDEDAAKQTEPQPSAFSMLPSILPEEKPASPPEPTPPAAAVGGKRRKTPRRGGAKSRKTPRRKH